MIETAPTLGSVETSVRQKRQYAQQSLAYNVKDANFRKLFPDYVEQHKAASAGEEDPAAPASSETGGTAGLMLNDRLEFHGVFATAAGLFAILSIVLAMRFF